MKEDTLTQSATKIAKHFYNSTKMKATPAMVRTAIGHAKSLINTGFTHDEIINAIDYCVANPPPKGFMSLGWLSYTMNDVLKKIKVKQIKDELNKRVETCNPNTEPHFVAKAYQKLSAQERVGEEFNFNIFEKGE